MKKKTEVKTAVPEIVEVTLTSVEPHPSNMRHVYETVPMAELVLKMVRGGYDVNSPAMVREIEDGSYQLIRGHRRRIALYFTSTLLALGEKPASEMTIEYVTEMLEATIKHCGSIQDIPTVTADSDVDGVMLPVIVNNGTYRNSLIDMWSDNFGSSSPDVLGMAYSFRDGIGEGYSVNEIAGAIGKPPSYVNKLISLGQVDPDIAGMIEREELALSVAPALMSLSEEKRDGATQFIKKQGSAGVTMTAKNLIDAMAAMKKWNGFTIPLTDSSMQRNLARSMSTLWNGRLTASKVSAWAAIYSYFYNNTEAYTEPYASPIQLHKWLVAFGLADGSLNITKARDSAIGIVGRFLSVNEVSCQTCPIKSLPAKRLGVDLPLPCRSNAEVDNCLRGLRLDDPFYVGIPSDWSGLPGVEDTGSGRYYATSYDNLLTAWEAREKLESDRTIAEAEAAQKIKEQRERDLAKVEAAAADAGNAKKAKSPKAKKPSDAETKEEAPPAPAADSPQVVARAQIGAYMMLNELGDGASHFMATPCSRCKHELDGSPTADPMVPNCAWAAGSLPVKFDRLIATDSQLQDVPICRQFHPKESMADIVPEYPLNGMEIARAMMVDHIQLVIDAGNGLRHPFEWLSGVQVQKRPVVNWASKLFKEESGSLSDGQIFMLFQLAANEDIRCNRHGGDGSFWIPESDKLVTRWVNVKTTPWDFE